MDTSDLAKRMKDYEQRNRYYLQRRLPVIIRLDMRAGHSFTKGFQIPFDEVFMKTMQDMAKYLCENIQNCKLAYIQSDECSLILTDHDKLNTDVWFNYRTDKMCSIAASMATMAFNKIFIDNIDVAYHEEFYRIGLGKISNFKTEEEYDEVEFDLQKRYDIYYNKINKAMFDARCFNIPKEEVTNCIYWRQLDASRNSIQMVGQANFSHKELQNKSCNEIQDMLMMQKGINWNDLPTYQKRGSCVVREEYWTDKNTGEEFSKEYSIILNRVGGTGDAIKRSRWMIDKDIPIFKGEGREYVDKLIYVGEE